MTVTLTGVRAMNWREMVSDKLMTPEEAVRAVKSGDTVAVSAINCTPVHACARRCTNAGTSCRECASTTPPRCSLGCSRATRAPSTLNDLYATPADREMVNAGQRGIPPGRAVEGGPPSGRFRGTSRRVPGAGVPAGPPRLLQLRAGRLLLSHLLPECDGTVVAEVHENFIRTGGDNYVHVSQLDRLCEATDTHRGRWRRLPAPTKTILLPR